jgi:hypothetical protein
VNTAISASASGRPALDTEWVASGVAMVQVGTQLQVADTGLLAITNRRAVYMGSRKTI